jgi:hypothetical protein
MNDSVNDNPKYHLTRLMQALKANNISHARGALLDLLDIKYNGNHARALAPYKAPLIKFLLVCVKEQNGYLAKALVWQLGQLGVKWPELDVISNSLKYFRG